VHVSSKLCTARLDEDLNKAHRADISRRALQQLSNKLPFSVGAEPLKLSGHRFRLRLDH
jgi:hypothetical protein